MMRQEFEALNNGPVTDEEWEVIHRVYQFHPSITDTKGKAQMVDLYRNFGMRTIYDLNNTAAKLEAIEADLHEEHLRHDKAAKELQDRKRRITDWNGRNSL